MVPFAASAKLASCAAAHTGPACPSAAVDTTFGLDLADHRAVSTQHWGKLSL